MDSSHVDSLGVTLKEPIDESLSTWLLSMDAGRFEMLAEAARRAPRDLFVDETDTAALLDLLAEQARKQSAAAD